jgi:integrase
MMTTTHYAERHEYYDGAVVVFKRADAATSPEKRFWQCRLKIDGRIGFKTISLKTRNREDAVSKAKSLYLQMTQTVRDGGSIDVLTFKKAWHQWFTLMVKENTWTPTRQRWHQDCFNRYWNSYFGEIKLDEINDDVANQYWSWRKQYWIDGPGADQTYNRQRKPVAYRTLAMEQSALGQFFTWCYSIKRYMRYPVKLKIITSKRSKEARRPTFTNAEWNALTRNFLSWANGKGKYAKDRLNEYHRHYRQQLRYYVLFLAATGIRSGTETRFMRWEDIEFGKDYLKIHIRKETKTGRSRTVISLPEAVALMKEWKSISRYSNDQDLVWYGNSKNGEPQQPATDLNRTFQSFLQTVDFHGRPDGLLYDADGKQRSLYSLRHFYITGRLLEGVTYEDVRRNAGTSIEYLVSHYDHLLNEARAAELTKTKIKPTKHKPITPVHPSMLDLKFE